MTVLQREEVVLVAAQTAVDEQVARVLVRMVVPATVIPHFDVVVPGVAWLIAARWTI